MQKIIKLVVFLALVSGLSGLCLSLVNDMTSPIIEEQKLAAVKENLEVLYSGAEFKEETVTLDGKSAIQNVYTASQGGSVTGYIYKVGVNGYGGEITFLVGINTDGSYQGFIALTFDQETKGFGSRIGDTEFSDQFDGKSIDDNIDTLSGATITSSAVVKGIDEAKMHFADNYK